MAETLMRPALTDPSRYTLELTAELLEKTAIAPEQLAKMFTADVGHTPSEVIYEENKVRLHKYEPEEVTQETPIVLVYALINRPYILDLQPNTSVIETLLNEGFEVYLVDWGDPSPLDRTLTFEDYVLRYLDNCLEEVCADADVEDVHLLGYCVGGTLAVMYTALEPERVRTLATMALAFSFHGESGLFETWAQHVDPDVLADNLGNMPKRPMAVSFTMKDPVDNYVTRFIDLYERLDEDFFVEMYSRIERWSWDGVDIAGETFRQFIGDIYQDNKLAANEFHVGDRHVDLETIDAPVLQVIGQEDTIAPPESSKPLRETIDSDDYTEMEFPTGHFGVSISPSAHQQLWPDVAAWFRERGAGAVDALQRDEPAGTAAESDEAEGKKRQNPSANGQEIEAVDGIGPTYAERLGAAGIETPADLSQYEPEELADIANAPASRASAWLEQVG